MKKRIFLLCAVLICLSTAAICRAEEHYEVKVTYNVAVKMRDGVTLRADIYAPKAEGKFPVLLQRTPYDKRWRMDFGLRTAALGYIVIFQDVRGRYASEGEWYPFKYESQDGYDTVEWAASLPNSNGKVGMFGPSYVGATQMLAAIASPPHLSGICPNVTASNYHENWTYQGGAFEQWFNESWTSGLAIDTLNRRTQRNNNAMQGVGRLPLSSYPLFGPGAANDSTESPRDLAPYFIDWLLHPSYDSYWKQISIEEYFSHITVPILHAGAWYDIFLGGTIKNYVGIKEQGGSEQARRSQRLLVMTGGHAGLSSKIGDVDFGKESVIDMDDVTIHWYDYLLKGVKNEFASEKPVKIFVMGKNAWREEEDWPLARAKSTRFYLHSKGKANSLTGDGSLSTSVPLSEHVDQYVADPGDPVPTYGGPLCCDAGHLRPGAVDQRPVEARSDVLVYSTAPLTEDLEVTGPISVELYAKSSAIDTDFTAKLVDVWPNGFAQNLTEGILRVRYRNSSEKPEFINPNEIYKLNIDLWATSNVFLKGHRLRLEISSSNFPRFDRNLNTGESAAVSSRWVKATNTIVHGKEHPSAIVLPVVP